MSNHGALLVPESRVSLQNVRTKSRVPWKMLIGQALVGSRAVASFPRMQKPRLVSLAWNVVDAHMPWLHPQKTILNFANCVAHALRHSIFMRTLSVWQSSDQRLISKIGESLV